MTTETFALLSFIACLTLGAGCVTLFVLWLAEGREVEDLRKSKEDLRESLTKHKEARQDQSVVYKHVQSNARGAEGESPRHSRVYYPQAHRQKPATACMVQGWRRRMVDNGECLADTYLQVLSWRRLVRLLCIGTLEK